MKKGFTLIELLAVIIILAVIVIITIPLVMNIIDNVREKAAVASAYSYIEEVDRYLVLSEIDPTIPQLKKGVEYQLSSVPYDVAVLYNQVSIKLQTSVESSLDLISPDEENFADPSITFINDLISLKGDKPTSGYLKLNNDNKIEQIEMIINSYLVKCTNNQCTLIGTKDEEVEEEEPKILYKENILNGTDPVLSGDLIPVVISDDGIVTKADVYSKWYSYEEKIWANAVILTPTGKIEEDGTIKEESIESYFVWIPRYKYQIFDLGEYETFINSKQTSASKAKEIQIIFENKDTAISNGNKVGEYLSHPAFQAFDVNGFWVGKFETTGNIDNLTVKPGLESIKNQSVSSMFLTALSYRSTNDSHMMKNTEWGAVAYLSYSKYGINSEININNHIDHLTGYSAVIGTNQSDYPGTSGNDSSVTLPYNTTTGYKASTTGNISGIYDMSGGTHEYMAAYMDGDLGTSGFTSDPATTYGSKYFDIYNSNSTITSYNNRILGDATGEMGPFYKYQDGDEKSRYHNSWFNDSGHFISKDYPWFARGCNRVSGVIASQFAYTRHPGGVSEGIGFRLVLIG